MGTLADLTSGFQSGYGFTQDARRQRQLDKLYGLEIDKRMMERKGQYDEFLREGGDPDAFGISKDPNEIGMGMTFGEKLMGKVKSWGSGLFGGDQGQEQTAGRMQGQEEEEKGKGSSNPRMQSFDDGGPVRGYAGPVRKALETRRQTRTYRPNPNASYADGGEVEEEGRRYREPTSEEGKRARSRKEARTGRAQAPNPTSTQNVPGKTRGYTAREKVNKAAGGKSKALHLDDAWNEKAGVAKEKPWYRSGVRGAAGRAARFGARAATPAAAIYSASQSYNTGTEEYQNRGGVYDMFAYDDDDSNLEMLGKDLATRTIGTFEDLGHTLTGGIFRPDSYDQGPEEAPEVAPAIEEAVDAPPPPEETAAQLSEKDPPGTAPQKKALAAEVGGSDGDITTPDEIIDFSSDTGTNIQPLDIPRHTTTEWEMDRKRARQNAVLMGKDPNAVDDAITATQMKNFGAYATQAHAHLVRGDYMGAARAMTAGFQYFPNGSDVNFGLVEGKDGKQYLVGMGKDEHTGETVGTPQVITPERLSVMAEMASNPNAWRLYTKDMYDRELGEKEFLLDRDYKEGMLGVHQENAISNRMRAEASQLAAMYRSQSAIGGGLPSESEVTTAQNEMADVFRTFSETMAELDDDRITALVGLGGKMYAETGVPYSILASYIVNGIKGGMTEEQIYMAFRQGMVDAMQGGGAAESP